MAGKTPSKLDFYAKQGDSFHSGPMQALRGTTPVPLTGATGLCQIRTAHESGVVATLTVVIDDAAKCQYHVEATAATMSAIPAPDNPTQYEQDVQFSWSSGYVETFTEGYLYLTPEVSR